MLYNYFIERLGMLLERVNYFNVKFNCEKGISCSSHVDEISCGRKHHLFVD